MCTDIDENVLIDEGWESGMMEHTAMTLQNLQAWAKQKWKHKHKVSHTDMRMC